MASPLLSKSPRKQGYGALQENAAINKTGPATASFLSRMLFSYANPMMEMGNKRQLNNEDLWGLDGENKTSEAYAKYKVNFDRCNGSVTRAMIYTNLVIWLGAFFISKLANTFVAGQMDFYLELIALRLTVSMKALLFEKAMRRSTQNKNDPDAVEMVNLFTSDVSSLLSAAYRVNKLWVLPLQVAVVVYMLYWVIGLAAFAGLAAIGLSMYSSFLIARLSGRAFKDVSIKKDARMKAIKEVFGAIQVVKLNAWELKFAEKIRLLRALELSAVARYVYISALSIFVLWSSHLSSQ
ncbi:hypothetical protein Poli38472_012132 [Pythium oligandrum]|uniref:ABC transmembrane type-1 domain-containing protein n=1 Tax=Pythium oligandrum TaxID=41045 RepID=A0A8K1CQV6_PYTOL|nr:hypothetical protein Poli38472_012132 [Pythium oligandrum]|eukprot:TMW67016.1 hypothetical protein Poli38472_012132 [Pythium oligandrum]